MQGNPDVIAALNGVYRLLLATEQQAHMQEHRYEAMNWEFSDWFDEIEEYGHQKLIHPLMSRINVLGGDTDFQYGFTPQCYGTFEGDGPESVELEKATEAMLGCLQKVHAAYGKACELAEKDDDYVTEKLIWKSLKWLEKRMSKFERRLSKIKRLGIKMFLAEYAK